MKTNFELKHIDFGQGKNILSDKVMPLVAEYLSSFNNQSELISNYYSAREELEEFFKNHYSNPSQCAEYAVSELMEFNVCRSSLNGAYHAYYAEDSVDKEGLSSHMKGKNFSSVDKLFSSILDFATQVDRKRDQDDKGFFSHLVYVASKFAEPQDKKSSLSLLYKAAEMSNPRALGDYAILLLDAKKEDSLDENAMKNLAKCLNIAYDCRYYNAAITLGNIYERGIFGQKNPIVAHKFYSDAAKFGNNLEQESANKKAQALAFELGKRFSEFSLFSDSLLWFAKSARDGNQEADEILKQSRISNNEVLNLKEIKKIIEALAIYTQKSSPDKLNLLDDVIQASKKLDLPDFLKAETKINILTNGQKTLLKEEDRMLVEEKVYRHLSNHEPNSLIDGESIFLERVDEDSWCYSCSIQLPSHNFNIGKKNHKLTFVNGSQLIFYKHSEQFSGYNEWVKRISEVATDLKEENNQLIFKLDLREFSKTKPKTEMQNTGFSSPASHGRVLNI